VRFRFETVPCDKCRATGWYRSRAMCDKCAGTGRIRTADGQRAFIRVRHWFGVGKPAGYHFGKGVTVRP
jgi:DnaJ-class molecular chaperone